MTRSRLAGVLCVAAALLLAPSAAAQVDDAPPIVVKQPKPKTLKFKGEVIHANRLQITVRSHENERVVRTFQLSPELQEKMVQIIDKGGYQYGDKVEIRYREGTEVAIKIKGKPSKPK